MTRSLIELSWTAETSTGDCHGWGDRTGGEDDIEDLDDIISEELEDPGNQGGSFFSITFCVL